MNNCFSSANRKIAFLIFSTFAALLLSDPVWAQSSSAKGQIIFDRYYTVKCQSQHCGYARYAVRQSPDKITFLSYTNMTLSIMEQDMHIVVKSISHEKPTGELISMQTTTWTNGVRSTKKAMLQDNQLQVTTELASQKSTEHFAIPPGGFTTDLAVERLIKPLLNQPGQCLELTVLSLEGGPSLFIPTTIEVISPETIQAYSQAVSAIKVKLTLTVQDMELITYSWFDQQGSLANRMSFGGLDIFLQAAEKEHAKKTPGKADLTNIALLAPKVPLKNPANASRAVYRLSLKDDQPFSFSLPQTDMQQVLAKGPNYLDVQITRQATKAFANQPPQQVPEELKEYLRPSLYLDWQNPVLKAAAKGIPVDSENPWDLALALWKYADETISTKELGVYFDPASKVLANRRGDCTEHAVLLAALARARGLPSRIVTGLVQVSGLVGHQTVFGYHAWTEVWINGQWIALDAALAQAPADVSHIALGVSAQNASDPAVATTVGLFQVIGNLEIEVLQQE